MSRAQDAASCFEAGFSCAQAVISTYGPGLGLERDTALRVAGAFGAGMARMGRACGAVTGALMVIGLQHGKRQAEDDETRDRCYELVKEFVVQFQARHGSITCKELLGYDLSIPEQRERAGQEGLFETLCPKLVRDAAEIVESLIVSREGAEARIGERRSGPASQMTNVGR